MYKKLKKLKQPFMIAEIGINHNGSINLAKKLIDLAKRYNFDCVKFQKRDPEICVPNTQKNITRETPWGIMTYLEYKKKIEFGKKEFDEINKYCKKKKIHWFASAWDKKSQVFLKRYKSKFNKVASAMITNISFLEMVACEKKKTFISTGMTNMKNIETAVKIFRKYKCPFTLLHCVSTYPCPEETLNLNVIRTLANRFKCDVGYSGHEGTVSPTIMAWFLGANVIERHITLDRTMWGTDQAASLSEDGIRNLTNIIYKMPYILGDGVKKFTSTERKISRKFRYWEN
ncbi:N-acetylneuraminate synthase family protein [Candidatus Pelagibacter sp.]|nr:N-acetylneuraminate synthase family protein [Candidatus Pelagibacter sp.]MDC3158081.1 N-acetylneuraminate synthase family protein [Candidatus Pelagibacter sp.]